MALIRFTNWIINTACVCVFLCACACVCVCVGPGVTVLKGGEEIEVHAPVVISNAGIFNTFQKFLPKQIQDKPGNDSQ